MFVINMLRIRIIDCSLFIACASLTMMISTAAATQSIAEKGPLPGAKAMQTTVPQVTVEDYLRQAEQQGLKANRLIDESSPYLLLHAYNPVNWYAWGEAAFEKARKENKPVFLSIGYSTCHWCHVMAHESFENKKIAELLNQYFVAIKVDREQRPDIDAVYMAATELINGHGGWPMTVFLDNQLRPFHAATYYPPFSSDAHLGLQQVLLKIHELWTKQPQRIDEVATAVTAKIRAMSDDVLQAGSADAGLSDDVYALALKQISDAFDEQSGGFSVAPKFPRPGIFALLNRLALRTVGDEQRKEQSHDKKPAKLQDAETARQMMKTTLDGMATGGIYDQLGGGFHRYAVDENWQVPHFEKMLYNQALNVLAYTGFYAIEPRAGYRQIIYDTLNFVRQEMRSPQGGYYSALDADSERLDAKGKGIGHRSEGAYYLWAYDELHGLLSADELAFVKDYFHIREDGNIDSDPRGEFTGLNIFYVDETYRSLVPDERQKKLLASVKRKLNKIRQQRPRPHLDDKIITAWNAMLLSAFAQASMRFQDAALLDDAKQLAVFIQTTLYDADSQMLRRQYRQAAAKPGQQQAILADYVWLIDALLNLYQASDDMRWLQWAQQLQEKQDELFLDTASGTYYEAADFDTNLLFRSRSIFDGALPAANAMALSNLRQFTKVSVQAAEKKRIAAQADRLVDSFAFAVSQSPQAASMILSVEMAP